MNKIKKIGVIWDWNGTVVDDAWLFVEILNDLLKKNNEPLIDIKQYRKHFCFPIDLYYKKLNLYKNDVFYKKICLDFIGLYEKKMFNPSLVLGIEFVFDVLKKNKIPQFVLSASNQKHIDALVDFYRVGGYFEKIIGTNNMIAEGKVGLGLDLVEKYKNKIDSWVVVGDTLLDFSVSSAVGGSFVFVSWGHLSQKRVEGKFDFVCSKPSCLLKFLCVN